MSGLVIGVDFDNTLVSYDALVHETAVRRGLIDASVRGQKRAVRDAVRRLDGRDGEIEWQRLQAYVYGPGMARARPVPGALDCVARLHRRGIPVYVVSHKTEFANYDETRTSLREAAMAWMAQHRFFEPEGLGLAPERVFFGATREEKIAEIRRLGCTHFIDDLEEVFLEPSFPAGVERILFAPLAPLRAPEHVVIMSSWDAIGDYLLRG